MRDTNSRSPLAVTARLAASQPAVSRRSGAPDDRCVSSNGRKPATSVTAVQAASSDGRVYPSTGAVVGDENAVAATAAAKAAETEAAAAGVIPPPAVAAAAEAVPSAAAAVPAAAAPVALTGTGSSSGGRDSTGSANAELAAVNALDPEQPHHHDSMGSDDWTADGVTVSDVKGLARGSLARSPQLAQTGRQLHCCT